MTDERGRHRVANTDSEELPLLEVEHLETHFPITKGLLRREVGRIRAVDGVSFHVDRGEALGLVGESGSGKTTTAHSILGLETITGGEIRFDGHRLDELSGRRLHEFRRRTQLIVQDPNEAFNPRMRIGEAVAEPLKLHGMDDHDRRRAIVENILERVGLSASDADRFPHEFSGGEKQRIAIARALVVNPDLIVADEPTSALDGRVQSDVLALLDEVKQEFDIAVLFISHDIDVVRRFCDRVAVMYLGEIVERGRVTEILSRPAHPYTRVLLGSIPSLDPRDRFLERPLTETVPDPADPPRGCRFHTRCPELIPPEDVELPTESWKRIAAFRFTLEAGELPESIDRRAEIGVDSDTVKEAFDLPAEISNRRIANVVERAVDAVTRGEIDAAHAALADEIRTVCERSIPGDTKTNEGTVSCHRYDPDCSADPLPWSALRS